MGTLRIPLSPRFDAALALAHRVHRIQARKGTQIPYIAHILGVAALVLEYGGGEDEAIGALLHDVLEDAAEHAAEEVTVDWLRHEIQQRFGDKVLAIVEHCTDATTFPKPSWRERKAKYLAALEHVQGSALIVSAADKFHNVQALIRDFKTHGEALWARFKPEAGREGTLGYYRSLVEIFRVRMPGRLTEDLETSVGMLEKLVQQGPGPG